MLGGQPMNDFKNELTGYVRIRTLYIEKKAILTTVLVLLAAITVGVGVLMPLYQKYVGAKELTVNTASFAGFTGYGRVLDLDGNLLYEGYLAGGNLEGFGALYEWDGTLLYEGDFVASQFQGQGTAYNANETLRYKGGFLGNRYEGQGKLFAESNLIYDGQFHEGLYSGFGKVFDNHVIQYEGDFVAGQYHGFGTLYQADGKRYEGDFAFGQRQGHGRLFQGETLLYEGDFVADVYQGQGKSYLGRLALYEGGFHNGLFHGIGTYYSAAQIPRYQGSFINGQYNGQGTLYDNEGRLMYEGAFTYGLYNGFGILYGPSGNPLFNGLFRNGHIDYKSLLGNSVAQIEQKITARPYLSTPSSLSDTFQCVGYDALPAALVFGVVDAAPAYVEAVIAWDAIPTGDGALAYTPPAWMDMFLTNPRCPITSGQLRSLQVAQDDPDIELRLWYDLGQKTPAWYSIQRTVPMPPQPVNPPK